MSADDFAEAAALDAAAAPEEAADASEEAFDEAPEAIDLFVKKSQRSVTPSHNLAAINVRGARSGSGRAGARSPVMTLLRFSGGSETTRKRTGYETHDEAPEAIEPDIDLFMGRQSVLGSERLWTAGSANVRGSRSSGRHGSALRTALRAGEGKGTPGKSRERRVREDCGCRSSMSGRSTDRAACDLP